MEILVEFCDNNMYQYIKNKPNKMRISPWKCPSIDMIFLGVTINTKT